MSNIFGIFSSGVSGLAASQAGIDVTGHNIANANNADYSRQRVELGTATPQYSDPGPYGRGVVVESITRIYDDVLAKNVRTETSMLNYYTSVQTAMEKIEANFNELEDGSGLGEVMRDYFNAWEDLSNSAADESDEALVKRTALLDTAAMMVEKMQQSYTALDDIQSENDYNITEYVKEINQLSSTIAKLNWEISKVEATGNIANDARDTREALLNNLSELVNTSVYERENGMVAVFIGTQSLVDEGQYSKLFLEDADSDGHVDVMWGTSRDTKGSSIMNDNIRTGKLAAELYIRDEVIQGYEDDLDTFAKTIIDSTNEIHALGQGLDRLSSITSTNGVVNPTYTLAEEPGKFNYPVQAGTIRISVYNDNDELVENYDIDINPDVDNLNAIVQRINSIDGDPGGGDISCKLTADNQLKIFTEAGKTFTFSEDTSGFLTAAGIYGFFEGTDVMSMGVNELVANNMNMIATGQSGAPGDNTNALAISDIKYQNVFQSNDITIDEFYTFFVSSMASDKSSIDTYVSTKTFALQSMTLQLEEVKGVSMDEELTNLIKFQRSYEASARFITTVDEMINKLVNGLGLVGR